MISIADYTFSVSHPKKSQMISKSGAATCVSASKIEARSSGISLTAVSVSALFENVN